MSRRRLVVGNWKMNGSVAFARELATRISEGAVACKDTSVAVCPPFPYLPVVAEAIAGGPVALGAQSVSEREAGAFTGEVAAAMLVDSGCQYVIVGHSERRALFNETSATVAEKAAAALAVGLTPIVCVGETLDDRRNGDTQAVIATQLEPVLGHSSLHAALDRLVFAYEPVWAIGTGETATPDQAQAVHCDIRSAVSAVDAEAAASIPILYGGSVKPDNAPELFHRDDVDGGLIGGASLKAVDFLQICGVDSVV